MLKKVKNADGDYFTAAQVVKLTGVPYGTLNYWAKIGLVKPSISTARGSGSRRIYDFRDLAAIKIALTVRRAGIFGAALAKILRVTRQAGFESPVCVAINITPKGSAQVTPCAGESVTIRPVLGELLLRVNCDFSEAAADLRSTVDNQEKIPKKPIKSVGRLARRSEGRRA